MAGNEERINENAVFILGRFCHLTKFDPPKVAIWFSLFLGLLSATCHHFPFFFWLLVDSFVKRALGYSRFVRSFENPTKILTFWSFSLNFRAFDRKSRLSVFYQNYYNFSVFLKLLKNLVKILYKNRVFFLKKLIFKIFDFSATSVFFPGFFDSELFSRRLVVMNNSTPKKRKSNTNVGFTHIFCCRCWHF